jgi:vancomycin resistance protein VanW
MKDAPREIRRLGCQLWRLAGDWLTGRCRKMVASNERLALEGAAFSVRLSIEQRVLATDYVEAKLHNIGTARRNLENLPLPPGGILSFWHVVGRPTGVRSFRPGRSLLGGQLKPDFGGGLCQLSGLIYHLCLQAGLEILERHPHSRDIYEDAERYTPLGADATVAYGFKDLRILNCLPAPVCFRFSTCAGAITGFLCSPAAIEPASVEFVRAGQTDGFCTVETRRRLPGEKEFRALLVSRYRRITPFAQS